MKTEKGTENLSGKAIKTSEKFNFSRRRFLRNAVLAVGAAQFGFTGLGDAQPVPGAETPGMSLEAGLHIIRPFRVNIPEENLNVLRRRILATRWPERETVTDESQGVQLATARELARYWAADYDWRRCEAKLNALPQFTTGADKGGHFAAWEQPELFASELRAGLKSLRS